MTLMDFIIETIPVLADNYTYLVYQKASGLAMVVDPGDGAVVMKHLKQRDLLLTLILNTHHHTDHIAGNAQLSLEYGAPILGPDLEKDFISNLARGLMGGDTVAFSGLRGRVMNVPGHTAGHLAFYFPTIKALFAGDALFSLGCGRLFEGSADQMWKSLCTLRELPDDTNLYCGHEYTESNAKFALALDADNLDLKKRAEEVIALRKASKSTLPSLLGTEKLTNPFLRADNPAFQSALAKKGLATAGSDPAAIFGALRLAKDKFSKEQSLAQG